jgi:hypothetical protein
MCTKYYKVKYYSNLFLQQLLSDATSTWETSILRQGSKASSMCGTCTYVMQQTIWESHSFSIPVGVKNIIFYWLVTNQKVISWAWLQVVSGRIWPVGRLFNHAVLYCSLNLFLFLFSFLSHSFWYLFVSFILLSLSFINFRFIFLFFSSISVFSHISHLYTFS